MKIVIWFRAKFLDYPYYRVYYKNGDKTHLLHKKEAKGLSNVFNGKLEIDYYSVINKYFIID